MSLVSWKIEFCPDLFPPVTEEQALRHSLSKWNGLRTESLHKHDLHTTAGVVIDKDGNFYSPTRDNSLLCHLYLKDRCMKCPMAEARYKIPCFVTDVRSEVDNPLAIWRQQDNPNPMLAVLLKAWKNYLCDHLNGEHTRQMKLPLE